MKYPAETRGEQVQKFIFAMQKICFQDRLSWRLWLYSVRAGISIDFINK